MRILVLSDKVLSRRLGDGLRVHGLLGQLASRHQFDFICFSQPGERLEAEMRGIFDQVTLVPAPEPTRTSLLRRAFRRFSASEFKTTSDDMRRAVATALQDHRYDLILEEAANTILNLPGEPIDTPIIVDSIDEPLLREVRALRHAQWRNRPGHLYRAWRFWQYERSMLERAALNIYVSELDASIYRRLFPGRAVAVVPNGVDTSFFVPSEASPDRNYIVFEGNMNFEPNVDTARRLVRDILPLVARQVPNIRVGLVGRAPVPQVMELASERVEVTGTVPDVRPYLARASVFVCPMRLGSGIKNKILQAWAMRRPVVATSASLGGLSAYDGVNLLVRDEPGSFADAVVKLIQDPDLAASLGYAGRDTVEREYSWQRRAQEFESLLLKTVEATSQPRGQGLPLEHQFAQSKPSVGEAG